METLEATGFEKRKRNVREEKVLRSEGELVLRDVSLSAWPLVLAMNGFKAGRRDPDMYSLLTFEPLQNFRLVISKMWKEFLVSYQTSDSVETNVSEEWAEPKFLVRMKTEAV